MTDNKLTDKEIMYANPLEWKLMVAKNTGHTKVTYDELNELVETINRQQAEIERLNKEVDRLSQVVLCNTNVDQIKAEAIKEFWSRLQGIAYQSSDWSHGEHPMVVELDDAEEIYEEMVGE